MAWLESYDDDNKIVDTIRTWTDETPVLIGTPGLAMSFTVQIIYQDITETKYRYVGMTYATALTCKAAMIAAGHEAELQRAGDGGQYQVLVVEMSEGTPYTEAPAAISTTTTTTTTTTTL